MTAEDRLIATVPVPLAFGEAKIGDLAIVYAKAGSGPPLVLLHGLNMGWGQWYPNIAEFAKHFTVYAIDLPGAGRSDRFRVSEPDFPGRILETVKGFIRGLGLVRPAILGHSFGAWIALGMALDEGAVLGKVVLMSPLGFSIKTPAKYRLLGIGLCARFLARTVMRLSRENMKNFVTSVLFQPRAVSEEFIDYYYDSLQRYGHEHPFSVIHRLSGFFRMRKEFFFSRLVTQLDTPTLIIVGEHDPITAVADVRAHPLVSSNHVSVVTMSKSGHVPSTEQATEFNALVVEFLKDTQS